MYTTTLFQRIREQRILHSVSLELTYRCNLDCFFCYNDRDKPGELLSLEQYRELLQDLARMQTLHLMLTGGEPMVHPHFFEIGAMAKQLGFVTRVRTNGHTLSARQCQRLKLEVDPYTVQVSLHGADAAAHDRQTRVAGSFERLLRNLAHAREAGLRCSLISTPTAWNEHQIDAMFELADELDLLLEFQGPVAPRDNGDLEPLAIQPRESTWDHIHAVRAARSEAVPKPQCDGNAEAASGLAMATCSVGLAGVDIDPYGNVQACMHLQEAAGNLHRQSIEEVWLHSPLFQRSRNKAVEAAKQFRDGRPRQFGANLYCIAVEENLKKSDCGSCQKCAS